MKLTHYKPPGPSLDIGWPESYAFPLAFVEIACAFLYLFPRTAALGAILVLGENVSLRLIDIRLPCHVDGY